MSRHGMGFKPLDTDGSLLAVAGERPGAQGSFSSDDPIPSAGGSVSNRCRSLYDRFRPKRTMTCIYITLFIFAIGFFVLLGLSVQNARQNSAKALSTSSNSLQQLLPDGWSVTMLEMQPPKNMSDCPLAVSWRTQHPYEPYSAEYQSSYAVLELEWISMNDRPSGATAGLSVTLTLPLDMRSGSIPAGSAYTVTCWIGTQLYTFPAGSSRYFMTSGFAIDIPVGSNMFYPADQYTLDSLPLMCVVTTSDPMYPILQVNKTAHYYYYPVMQPNSALTTTGITCKPNPVSTLYNEAEASYICPTNSIPLALNMVVKISKGAAGDFEHSTVLSPPMTNDCMAMYTLKATFRRPTVSQLAPVLTAMAAWLTFSSQTVGLMPYFLNKAEVTIMTIFQQTALIAGTSFSGVSYPPSSILYYCSSFWLNILSIVQFAFLSYKYAKVLAKSMRGKAKQEDEGMARL